MGCQHARSQPSFTRAAVDSAEYARAIAASASDALVSFLRVELEVANTMLDAAAATSNGELRARRRDLAHAAHDEVARRLTADAPLPGVTLDVRAELSFQLALVQGRLDSLD